MPERLLEFNRLELRRKLKNPIEENILIENVQEMVKNKFPGEVLQTDKDHVRHILEWSVNRINKLSDLLEDHLKFIWVQPLKYDEIMNEATVESINLFVKKLENTNSLEKTELNTLCKEFCKEHKIKFSNFMRVLRAILSGLRVSLLI